MNLMLLGDYPDDPTLGSAKVMFSLAAEFRRRGHRCDLLFAPDLGAWPRSMHPRHAVGPLLAARAVVRRVRRAGPYDVIDAAGGEGLAVPLLRRLGVLDPRTAFVSRSHGLEHRNYARMLDDARAGLLHKPWYRRIWYPLWRLTQVRAAAAAAEVLVVPNAADAAFAVARRWRPAERVAVVPHGVGWHLPDSAPPTDAPRGGGLLFCGTWTGVKGIDYLVPAFARLIESGSSVPLTVLGPGVPADAVLGVFPPFARRWVTVLPRSPETKVLAEYDRHDLLLFPSTYEGFGLAVAEAMARRLVVIATPVGGVPDLIRDGETGLLVPPRDPAALVAAIRLLLADPALRRRLGDAGHARVKTLTWAAAADRTLAVYRAAAEARR